jgi:hypothetical protein
MKKAVIAIFSMFYLLFSSGVAFTVHYCMGERDAVKLGASKTKICGRCGMEESESKGCCEDEQHFVKITDDQLSGSGVVAPGIFSADAVATTFTAYIPMLHKWHTEKVFFSDTSPPPLIFSRAILFSNFRV